MNMAEQTLEVLICTVDERINNVVRNILPPCPFVKYLVSWQYNGDSSAIVPLSLANREDVEVIVHKGYGLSANRNCALCKSTGDILLISDDDACYRPEHFSRIKEAFRLYADADMLLFRMSDLAGRVFKPYPVDTYVYPHMPYGCYVSSLEIAFRRGKPVPLFDVRFGLGSDYLACGEEEVFVYQAYRLGLHIRYVPVVVVCTPHATTGCSFRDNVRVRRSKGAVLYMLHGFWGAFFRCLLFAFHQKQHTWSFFSDMFSGIWYIKHGKK